MYCRAQEAPPTDTHTHTHTHTHAALLGKKNITTPPHLLVKVSLFCILCQWFVGLTVLRKNYLKKFFFFFKADTDSYL